MAGIMLPESEYYFLITHVTEVPAGWSYISATSTCVRKQATVFSIHGFVSVAVNANYLRDLVTEEALTTYTPPYAFLDRSEFILALIFKRMLFFPAVLRPDASHGLLILEVSRSHKTTHRIR
jgi:hypothetical protein